MVIDGIIDIDGIIEEYSTSKYLYNIHYALVALYQIVYAIPFPYFFIRVCISTVVELVLEPNTTQTLQEANPGDPQDSLQVCITLTFDDGLTLDRDITINFNVSGTAGIMSYRTVKGQLYIHTDSQLTGHWVILPFVPQTQMTLR